MTLAKNLRLHTTERLLHVKMDSTNYNLRKNTRHTVRGNDRITSPQFR